MDLNKSTRPVFAYLLDHKMDEARKMLESQKYNVNEMGKLGYSFKSLH